MKKIILIFITTLTFITFYAQTNSDGIGIHDTRSINDAPNFNKRVIRADFKARETIGVPGSGNYSGNITISPWSDASGGLNYQLNFNEGGLFYRSGSFNNPTWNGWQKVLIAEQNGSVRVQQLQIQTIDQIPDWNNIRYSGFFQSIGGQNSPGQHAWYWGLNIRHQYQADPQVIYNYGGQMAIGVNYGMDNPQMYIRSTNVRGEGPWAKVITDKGDQEIAGKLKAREIEITITAGSDYVFNQDYNLKPLSEVEAFVKENKHLPEIPSEKQMQENGLNINEFQIKLLQKIEELTLYTIQLEKRIKQLEN